jgi:hypothetical protein
MKPDFNSMSKDELKAYVLAHRNEDEAFYKLVDRYKADSKDRVWHPCPKTPEEWEKVPHLIQEQIEKLDK